MPVLCFYFDRHPAAMVTHETKLVTHISALFFVIKLAASQRSALFNMEENSKLVGSLLKARRNSDSMTCAHWCLSEPLCPSFNYQSGQRSLCELNRASGHNLEGLRREPGWLHGVLIARQEQKKPQGEADPDPNFSTLWDFSSCIFRSVPLAHSIMNKAAVVPAFEEMRTPHASGILRRKTRKCVPTK